MYLNPAFQGDEARNLAFARTRAFGVLTVNGAAGPEVVHVPFLLSEDGRLAEAHLLRSNPVARALTEPQRAVLAVSGPDGYISPDWYGTDDMVPTWNYVAVQLRGVLELRPHDEVRDLLVRQSAAYEARLTSKPAWKLDKMSPGSVERMQRMIVPVRLTVETVEGVWKLGQNRTEAQRQGAADALETGFGTELAALSALMRAAGVGAPE